MQAPWRDTDGFASLDKDFNLEELPDSFYGHSSGLQVYYRGNSKIKTYLKPASDQKHV